MKTFSLRVATVFLAVFVAGAALQAASASLYLIEKQQVFLQTSASAPTPLNLPFEFSAQSPAASNLTLPSGSLVSILFNSSNGNAQYLQAFATQAAMDASFPDGTYSFSGSAPVASSAHGRPLPCRRAPIHGRRDLVQSGAHRGPDRIQHTLL